MRLRRGLREDPRGTRKGSSETPCDSTLGGPLHLHESVCDGRLQLGQPRRVRCRRRASRGYAALTPTAVPRARTRTSARSVRAASTTPLCPFTSTQTVRTSSFPFVCADPRTSPHPSGASAARASPSGRALCKHTARAVTCCRVLSRAVARFPAARSRYLMHSSALFNLPRVVSC